MQPYNIPEVKSIAMYITEYCNLYNTNPERLKELKQAITPTIEHLDWLIANPE